MDFILGYIASQVAIITVMSASAFWHSCPWTLEWYYYAGDNKAYICYTVKDYNRVRWHEIWHYFYFQILNQKGRDSFKWDKEEFAEAFRSVATWATLWQCFDEYTVECKKTKNRIRQVENMIKAYGKSLQTTNSP